MPLLSALLECLLELLSLVRHGRATQHTWGQSALSDRVWLRPHHAQMTAEAHSAAASAGIHGVQPVCKAVLVLPTSAGGKAAVMHCRH
jgi:hypothetical protein